MILFFLENRIWHIMQMTVWMKCQILFSGKKIFQIGVYWNFHLQSNGYSQVDLSVLWLSLPLIFDTSGRLLPFYKENNFATSCLLSRAFWKGVYCKREERPLFWSRAKNNFFFRKVVSPVTDGACKKISYLLVSNINILKNFPLKIKILQERGWINSRLQCKSY